jgi:hypothetical protein
VRDFVAADLRLAFSFVPGFDSWVRSPHKMSILAFLTEDFAIATLIFDLAARF